MKKLLNLNLLNFSIFFLIIFNFQLGLLAKNVDCSFGYIENKTVSEFLRDNKIKSGDHLGIKKGSILYSYEDWKVPHPFKWNSTKYSAYFSGSKKGSCFIQVDVQFNRNYLNKINSYDNNAGYKSFYDYETFEIEEIGYNYNRFEVPIEDINFDDDYFYFNNSKANSIQVIDWRKTLKNNQIILDPNIETMNEKFNKNFTHSKLILNLNQKDPNVIISYREDNFGENEHDYIYVSLNDNYSSECFAVSHQRTNKNINFYTWAFDTPEYYLESFCFKNREEIEFIWYPINNESLNPIQVDHKIINSPILATAYKNNYFNENQVYAIDFKLNTSPEEYPLVDPQYIQQTLKNHLYACIASDDSYKEPGRTAGYSLRNYNQEKIIIEIKGDKILSFKNENIYDLNEIFFSLLNRKECFDLSFADYWATALTKYNYELELDFTYLFNNQNIFNNAYNVSLKQFSNEESLIQNLDSYKSKYVKADVLNVRDDIDGNIIGKIYINDIISIINERANWSLIANTDGLTGWVSSQYLSDNQRVLSVNTNSIKLIDYMCKSDLNENELCLENFQLSQVSEMKNMFNNHDLIKSMEQTTLSTEEDKYFKYIDLYLNSKHKSNNKVSEIVKNQKKQLEKIVPYFLDQFKEQSYLNLDLKGKNCSLDFHEYEDNDYGLFTECRLDLFKQDEVTTSVRIHDYLYKEDTGTSISFQIDIDDLSEYYLSDGTSFKENNLELNYKYEINNFLQDLISKYSSYNYSAATLDIRECDPSNHENIKNYCETITDKNRYYPDIEISRVKWFIDDYLSLTAWISNYDMTIYIDDVRFDNSHLYEENANYIFSDYSFEKTFSVFDNDKKYYANLASDIKTNNIEKPLQQNLDDLVSENLIDETSPTISCIQSEITKDSKINIKCSISDDSDIYAVILNGKKLSGNLENINEDILLPFGESNIELIALDKYGNKEEFITSVNREFTLDKTIDEVDGLFPGKIKDKSSNDKVAVIIGIQNYDDIPDTKYSDKDAMAFAEFANQTLNIPSKNIKYLFNEDAKYFGFKGIRTWLENKVNKNTDVYVFYSGHGLGVEGKSKLLPSDFVTQFQEESSYEKDEFLSDIANLNPNHIYAFFDTCFSGLGRDGETLIAGLKNINIVEEVAPVDNVTIFNSSSGLEYSTDFDEAGHGLFSYYLMKGLEGNADINSDNEITTKELFSFIKENVSDRALDIGLSQNPSLIGESDNVIVRW